MQESQRNKKNYVENLTKEIKAFYIKGDIIHRVQIGCRKAESCRYSANLRNSPNLKANLIDHSSRGPVSGLPKIGLDYAGESDKLQWCHQYYFTQTIHLS